MSLPGCDAQRASARLGIGPGVNASPNASPDFTLRGYGDSSKMSNCTPQRCKASRDDKDPSDQLLSPLKDWAGPKARPLPGTGPGGHLKTSSLPNFAASR